MSDEDHGLDRGLTNYGDRDFARFLRRSFARSMGISTGLLNRTCTQQTSQQRIPNRC